MTRRRTLLGVVFCSVFCSVMLLICSCNKKAAIADSRTDSATESSSDSASDILDTATGDTDTEDSEILDDDTDTGVSALQAVTEMKIGINIGNTLDATDGETAWGNPAITSSYVQGLADAGFGVVRIPVSWSPHFGVGPEYTIDPAWLERVQEVVGYVIDAGMYAIINMQHDGSYGFTPWEWISLTDGAGQVTEENNQAVLEQYTAVWAQIANHFSSTDSHLIFESMNEVRDGEKAPTQQYYDILNQLNQAFVDTVRAVGGKNTHRMLSLSGYYGRVDATVEGFVQPTDTVADRLMVSVHYYDPVQFTYTAETHTWGAESPGADSTGQEDAVVEKMNALKTAFVNNGLPVVISEYGAVQQTGYDDYRRYYLEYVNKAAKDAGIITVYWDNGNMSSGQDAFGLMFRNTGETKFPELLDAMMHAVTDDYAIEDVAPPVLEVDTEVDTDIEDIGTDDSGFFNYTDALDNQFGLYVPENWSGANYPIVMFLHGYTGNPIGLTPWIVNALNEIEPCVVFMPVRPASEGASAWGGTYDEGFVRPGMQVAVDELDHIVEYFGLNTQRQYLYGESMGGEGVYKLLVTYPDRFAATVVVAGYTIVSGPELMAQTPLWIIHGNGDTIADVSNAQNIHQAILDAGGDQVIYTEYDGMEHVPTISNAISEPGLMDWVVDHTRE